MADWATISALATGAGTLVLAAATFASVRSANRAARAAERSLLAGIRPVLMPSRWEDPVEKVGFVDGHWLKVPGGHGVAEVGDGAIYLAIALRNVGPGLAVLHGWFFHPDRVVGDVDHPPVSKFQRLTRDIYLAPASCGFYQGAFRDPAEAGFAAAREAIEADRDVTVDLLYGDHEGGQRTISRFTLMPRSDGSRIAAVTRHWSLDRPDPR